MSKKNQFVKMYYGLGSNRTKPGREGHPYPQGDGKRDCKDCYGRGVVTVPEDERPPFSIGEVTRSCFCTYHRDTLMNMERGWRGLTKTSPVKTSDLMDLTKVNLWVTSGLKDLQRNICRVSYDKGRHWNFRVITDVSLMSAWLYSANDVIDADVHLHKQSAEMEDRYSRIEDLVESWDLLIIRLGVKTARNKAAPEVLLEALQIREQIGKPTWVIDSPGYPLVPGHISWDARVEEYLLMWDRHVLSEGDRVEPSDPRPRTGPSISLGSKTPKALPSSPLVRAKRVPATAASADPDDNEDLDLEAGLAEMGELDAKYAAMEAEETAKTAASEKKNRSKGRGRNRR